MCFHCIFLWACDKSDLISDIDLYDRENSIYGDSAANDTIKEDTTKILVKVKDTVKYISKENFKFDFKNLSYNNIVVKSAFKMKNVVGTSYQGMAIFNDYMFQTHSTANYIDVYNLLNYSLAFSISMWPEATLHCNNADFGPYYYEQNDSFPLLYLGHKSGLHKTSVYRIIKKEEKYAMEHIQDIDFYPCSNTITNNDNANGHMYVSNTINDIRYITKIKTPYFDSSYLTLSLNKENTLDNFAVEQNKVAQDATVYNNILFQLKGGSGEGEICLYDLVSHKQIFVIDWNVVGMRGEPEGIAWYKDRLVVTNLSGLVYFIYFVNNEKNDEES